MNETNWVPALVSAIALLVTIVGWGTTARLQGEIQKSISEHDTRFAYLHKRRGEVIDQLYKQICKMKKALTASLLVDLNDTESLKEHRKNVHKIFYELNDYYRENRLYLDEELCQKIEELATNMGNALEHTEISNTYPDIVKAYRLKSNEIIAVDIHSLQKQIEGQMRKTLGLDNQSKLGH